MDAVEPTDQYDIDSYDAIYKVVDLAMKGAAEGDLAKLGAAFHADARMYGEVYGQRYDEPIAAFFDLCKRQPPRSGRPLQVAHCRHHACGRRRHGDGRRRRMLG